MTFLDKDWARISLKSYTAWAFYALALITIAPDLIYWLFGSVTNPLVWGRLQLVAIIGGWFGRVVLQPKANHLRRKVIIGVIIAAIFAVSIPAFAHDKSKPSFAVVAFDFISGWEGKRNIGYLDIVGVPTDCYGHTLTAVVGQYKSDAVCRQQLIDEISEYRAGLHTYFNPYTKAHRLPVTRDVAYTSLAYNVGVRAAGRSTATSRLNAGNIIGGCNALTWFNRAGGRVVRGLVRRRSEEQRYCLVGTD